MKGCLVTWGPPGSLASRERVSSWDESSAWPPCYSGKDRKGGIVHDAQNYSNLFCLWVGVRSVLALLWREGYYLLPFGQSFSYGIKRRKKVWTQIAKENRDSLKCEGFPTMMKQFLHSSFWEFFDNPTIMSTNRANNFFCLEKSVDSALPLTYYLQKTTLGLCSLDSCSVENLYSLYFLHCNAHQVWEKWECSPSSISYWWQHELTCWTLTSSSSALPSRWGELSMGWDFPTGPWRSLKTQTIQQKTANE